MLAVKYEDDGSGTIPCGICGKECAEAYMIEPENDEEYDALEQGLGDTANWSVCPECLVQARRVLGSEIRMGGPKDLVDVFDRQAALYGPEVPEEVLDRIKAMRGSMDACPKCGNSLDIAYNYVPWTGKRASVCRSAE